MRWPQSATRMMRRRSTANMKRRRSATNERRRRFAPDTRRRRFAPGRRSLVTLRRWLTALVAAGLAAVALAVGPRATPVRAASFMVRPVIPTDNRVPASAGYFDLRLREGTERQVAVMLANTAKTPQLIHVALLDAVTAAQGVVAYVPAEQRDALLTKPGSRLVRYPTTVRLAAHETRQVVFTVPAQSALFTGTKAMAIQLTGPAASGQGAVASRVRYRIGWLLSGRPLAAGLHLGLGSPVSQTPRHLRLRLVNRRPQFIRRLSVKATLTAANRLTVPLSQVTRGMKVAPQSAFAYTLGLGGRRLPQGVYALTLRLSGSAGPQRLRRYLRVGADGRVAWTTRTAYLKAQALTLTLALAALAVILATVGLLHWCRRPRRAR
ncbi:WxL protein peptidoglycan domain-containing protein [Lacticaseibacillus suihuaensis]